MPRIIKQALAIGTALVVVSPLVAFTPAAASESRAGEGVVVESTFDPTNAVRVDDEGRQISRGNPCHDRAFAAIPTMLTSVPGCSIIGSSKNTKITYSWYRDRGKVGVCVWGKGFNSRAQTTWTAAGCGTGRRGVVVNWGNVAASKQIRGMTASGAAGVQWG